MTSEERASKFLSEPIRVEDFRTALINLLDEHAAEQRESYADAVIDELRSIGFQIYESGEARIRDACLNATGESDE